MCEYVNKYDNIYIEIIRVNLPINVVFVSNHRIEKHQLFVAVFLRTENLTMLVLIHVDLL